MRTELPEEGLDFGRTVAAALRKAGGVDQARRAITDPDSRRTEVEPLLRALGVLDLRPTSGLDELTAAAAACRAAGANALPYPLVGRLLGVVLVDPAGPVAEHGDLMNGWTALSMDGRHASIEGHQPGRGTITTPFARGLTVGPWSHDTTELVPLALALGAWLVLGSLQTAIALSVQHAKDRRQFGRPIAELQVVQFQLADASVDCRALEVLAEDALARTATSTGAGLVDALGLHVAMQEASERIFRLTHQLHGAVGFCDEHDLSWLSRFGQVQRRTPMGAAAARRRLARTIDELGYDSLFPIIGVARG